MNTAELLDEVTRRGIRLEPDGDTLCYTAPKGALTKELLAELKAHKAELLAELELDKPKIIPFPKIRDCGPAMLLRPGRTGNKPSDYAPSEKIRIAKLDDAGDTGLGEDARARGFRPSHQASPPEGDAE